MVNLTDRRLVRSWLVCVTWFAVPCIAIAQEHTAAVVDASNRESTPLAFSVDSQPGNGTLARPHVRGGTPFSLAIGTQVFTQYNAVFPSGAAWTHSFDLTRAWLFVGFRVGDALGRVLVEGTRGTNDGSLSGVAQDSFLVRVREGWVGYRLLDSLEIRAGMIPALITPTLTSQWAVRAVNQTSLREFDLIEPADLGGSLRFDFPERFGWVGAAYLNGEGYASRDINRGKNIELIAELHPLASIAELVPLTLTAAYTNGSVGAGSARSDRAVAALAWNTQAVGVGVNAAYVLGVGDRGEREAALIEGWARAQCFSHLLLGVQASHFVRNLAGGGDALSQLTLYVGAHIVDALRAFVVVDGRFATDAARVAVPAWERWQLRVVVEGNFVGRFSGSILPNSDTGNPETRSRYED